MDQGETITALQVLERHSLDERGFSGPRLSNYVDMRKTVLVLNAKDAIIVAKIDPPNVYDIIFVHPSIVVISDTHARDEVLPRNGIHALTISADSSI